VLLVVALAAVAAGCGIRADDAPRDIAVEDRPLAGEAATGAAAAEGASRVYLVTPNEADAQRRLRSVQRDVQARPAQLLEALFDGPNTAELASGVVTAIPTELELRSARSVGEVLYVDVSEELAELSGDVLILAIGQIVHTASELDGVSGVRLRVNGSDQPWPKGDGGSATGNLTVYDYPGLVESAQPAYPALP
jgi:spore germination protein GerM